MVPARQLAVESDEYSLKLSMGFTASREIDGLSWIETD